MYVRESTQNTINYALALEANVDLRQHRISTQSFLWGKLKTPDKEKTESNPRSKFPLKKMLVSYHPRYSSAAINQLYVQFEIS